MGSFGTNGAGLFQILNHLKTLKLPSHKKHHFLR